MFLLFCNVITLAGLEFDLKGYNLEMVHGKELSPPGVKGEDQQLGSERGRAYNEFKKLSLEERAAHSKWWLYTVASLIEKAPVADRNALRDNHIEASIQMGNECRENHDVVLLTI